MTFAYSHDGRSVKLKCEAGHTFNYPSTGWSNNLSLAESWRKKRGGSPIECPICKNPPTEPDFLKDLNNHKKGGENE